MLDELLASKVAVSLLRVLCTRPYEEFHLRRLVREAEVGYGSANRFMKSFEKAGIVTARPSGKQRVYRINLSNEVAVKLYELFSLERKTEAAREYRGLVDEIALALVGGIGQELKSIVLFGSLATGQAAVGSDVDLLIITERPEAEYGKVPHDIGRRASFFQTIVQKHWYSVSEFEDGYWKGDDVVLNAIRDGIVIHDDGYFRDFAAKPLPSTSPVVVRSLLQQAIKDTENARRNLSEEDYGTVIELLRLAVERAARAELLEKHRLAGSHHELSKALQRVYSKDTARLFDQIRRYANRYAHTGKVPGKKKVWQLLQATEDLVRKRFYDLGGLVG